MIKGIIPLISLFCLTCNAASIDSQISLLQQQINLLQQQIQQKDIHSSLQNNAVGVDESYPLGEIIQTQRPLVYLEGKQAGWLSEPLTLGGHLQMDLQRWDGTYTQKNAYYQNGAGSGLFIGKLLLFNVANINSWTQGAIILKRGATNNILIDNAFVTFGNFNKNPFYFNLGQAYLPFGLYVENGPWINNLDTNAFRSNNTQIQMGWHEPHNDFIIGAYTTSAQTANYLASFHFNGAQIQWGASFLTNIAATSSAVGSAYASTNCLSAVACPLSGQANPAVDGYIKLNVTNALTFYSEYTTTLSQAYVNGLTPTGKMSAWTVGGNYKNTQARFPWSILLNYSDTQNMASISMPLSGAAGNTLKTNGIGIKDRCLGVFKLEVVPNVYIGPELAYDKLYNGQFTSTYDFFVDAFF